MKLMQFKQLPLRLKIVGLAFVALLIALGAWIFYLRSPLRILHLTLAALERQDAAALVELASEKEVKTLNLTPQNVGACLQETYWHRNARPPKIRIRGVHAVYANNLNYLVDLYGFSSNGKPVGSAISIYHGPSGKWRLALSSMLYLMTRDCLGIKDDHAPIWDAMARRHGIKGVSSPDGLYRNAADGSHTSIGTLSD
ncbi:MAG TPA: hypothetical protein VNJ09_06215 [Chthonomonadales bacterium]|nr:hypothetical protein [Chthonomonadales bacterium]